MRKGKSMHTKAKVSMNWWGGGGGAGEREMLTIDTVQKKVKRARKAIKYSVSFTCISEGDCSITNHLDSPLFLLFIIYIYIYNM